MTVRPPQTVGDVAPQPRTRRARWRLLDDADARDEDGVDEVAHRVEGDRDRRGHDADQDTSESRAHRLRCRITLVDPRIRRQEERARDDSREEGLRRGESDDGQDAEHEQRRRRHPEVQEPGEPEHRDRAQAHATTDTRPDQEWLAPESIDVRADDQPEQRVREELGSVHQPHLERAGVQHGHHENRYGDRADC